MTTGTSIRWITAIAAGLILTSILPGKSFAANPGLVDQAITRVKAPIFMFENVDQSLVNNKAGTVKVWVFFTDKGVFNKTDFDNEAASVHLSDRALKRRAKAGRDKVLFVDLPVVKQYVQDIEGRGAHYRRTSRWLNAASFSMPFELLQEIGSLPFVAELRPLAGFSGSQPVESGPREESSPQTGSSFALDYGESSGQLGQINVPAVHNLGLTGAGVTLAIMDTGYRKSHSAFAAHYAAGRVLAEWDFINDDNDVGYEDGDPLTQWNHGTSCWSLSAGQADGQIYGPAYQANIILCKTEDISSETPVEEDNWVAAMEWADSIGTDVITTSLGYMTFDDGSGYAYQDMDGLTATITLAANTCDGLGIVFCNSIGNDGPGLATLSAPADAFDILAVGAVFSNGSIVEFSSRGPTYDGRIKPEVCAQGSGCRIAQANGDDSYGYGGGTSFSTPLVAGAACLIIEAHPDWTAAEVREALKSTANNAISPNNDYGWGIIDTYQAMLGGEPCCIPPTLGDLDQSGEMPPGYNVDGTDLTMMIDMLFITLQPVICLEEADLDGSGGTDPQIFDIDGDDLSLMIDHLFITYQSLPGCP